MFNSSANGGGNQVPFKKAIDSCVYIRQNKNKYQVKYQECFKVLYRKESLVRLGKPLRSRGSR